MITFKNPKIQKLISSILILSVFVPSVAILSTISFQPKVAKAQMPLPGLAVPTNDLPQNIISWKELLYKLAKEIAMVFARKLLNKMTQAVVTWINTGRWGNPFYLDRPDQFFKDILKFEVTSLINSIAYDSLRFPFGRSVAGGWVNAYNSPVGRDGSYTLSAYIKNAALLARYRNNFYVGGWYGFFVNTQYQQNNYAGSLLLANEALARKVNGTIQTNTQKVNNVLAQAGGFLAPKMCPTNVNPAYNNGRNEFKPPVFNYPPPVLPHPECEDQGPNLVACPDKWYEENQQVLYAWEMDREAAKVDWEKKNSCPGGLVTTTPGTVVGNQISTALGSRFHSAELGTALGSSFAAIMDALIDKLINKGLNAFNSTEIANEKVGGIVDPTKGNDGSFPGDGTPPPGPGGGPPPPGGKCSDPDAQQFLSDLQSLYSTVSGININDYIPAPGAYSATKVAELEAQLQGIMQSISSSKFAAQANLSGIIGELGTWIVEIPTFMRQANPTSTQQAINAALRTTNVAITTFLADSACVPPGPPPPGGGDTPPGGWQSYFFSILDQSKYPVVSTEGMVATEGGLEAYGAYWQNADANPPRPPSGWRPRIERYGGTTVIADVGDFGGPWIWVPR